MTQGMLLGGAVLMIAPTLMIFLSLILETRANRLVNIVSGFIFLAVLVETVFSERNPAYYFFLLQ